MRGSDVRMGVPFIDSFNPSFVRKCGDMIMILAKRVICSVTLALLGLLASQTGHAATTPKTYDIKIATLAPEGSTWWKLFKEFDAKLRAASSGRIRIKLYAGGVAGDESVVVRKMRLGQLQGAAITSVGMAEIAPDVLALQAPGLFRNWEELDQVRNLLAARFSQLVEDKGFTVALWGDVGFNRFFSATPVATPADLKKTKPWGWTLDGSYRAYYEQAGVNAVLTGVPEVLPGLQTGLLNAFSAPPLVAVSMQWFSHAKYMMDLPLNVTIGAVVMKKSVMDGMSPEDQAIFSQACRDIGVKLAAAVRHDHDTAVNAIKSSGIQLTAVNDAAKQAWMGLAEASANRAASNGVYSRAVLDEIRTALKSARLAYGGK